MDTTRYAAALQARKEKLIKDMHKIEDQLDVEPPKDWEDRSSERQGDEVLEALGHQDLHELEQINAALQRLDDGTYGQCVQCGNDILPARLDLLPETPFCKTCAI